MNEQANPPKAVFTGGACARCFKLDHSCNGLMKCGGCKHAWYCSKECQKQDWTQHKRICKSVGAISTLITKERLELPPTSHPEFNVSAAKCALALATMLQRPPTQYDSLLFQGEAHCPLCFRTRDTLPEGVTLRNCSSCSWGWACSEHWEQLQGQHSACCAQYAMLNRVEALVHAHLQQEGGLPSWCSEVVRQQAQQLPAGGWREYMRWRPVPTFKQEYFAAVSSSLSQPLTTLLGLQHHLRWEQLAALSSLTVHVVGAAQQDGPQQAGMVWEELLHLLPLLKTLHVVFVGPELGVALLGIRPEPLQVGTCMQCESSRRQRLYSVDPSHYHEYAKKRHYCKPTIVVAFNSGCGIEVSMSKQQQQQQAALVQPSSWQPTLQLLLDQGTPCIFTCYNSAEAQDDMQVVRQAGGCITQQAVLNPYSGLVEYPDVDDPCQFYRSSMYYFCFRGRA